MPDTLSSPRETMIQLDGISKHYPGQDAPAVRELSLSIRSGELVVFVGPSGCGKTTTLRMINRLVEPSEGKIWIDGEDVTEANPDLLRRRMGYVIQNVGLLPHLTVLDNIGLVPKLNGASRAEQLRRSRELLELVGLDPETFGKRYPRALSGGQQQRVGVCRALAADPPVLLMDEPFGALDPIARKNLQDELLRLQRQLHKTIVFVTHDIDEALRLGDRIVIFDKECRIAQYATPLEILTDPADQFVRDFVGSGAALRRLALVSVGDVLDESNDATRESKGDTVEVTPETTVQDALDLALGARSPGVHTIAPDGRTLQIGLQQLLLASADAGAVANAAIVGAPS
jgi:osmoprotectant transport system ATP-binding protein